MPTIPTGSTNAPHALVETDEVDVSASTESAPEAGSEAPPSSHEKPHEK